MDAFAALRPFIARSPGIAAPAEHYCSECEAAYPSSEFYQRGRLRKDGSRGLSNLCKTHDKRRISAHRSAKRRARRG